MASFTRLMEGLTGTVARKYGKVKPADSSKTTAVTVDRDDAGDGLPIGYNSLLTQAYERRVRIFRSRSKMYQEFDEMDNESPEFSSALDIFADNSTRGDEDGEASVTIKCDNPKATKILHELRDRLDLEGMIWTLARDISKYGERAEEVIVDDKYDIIRTKPLPTQRIFPQRDAYGRKKKKAYVLVKEDKPDEEEASYYDWQVLYFANKKSRSDLAGRSIGHSARRPWKQLRMMEDAVVIARLTRAHNRLAYMVDTGKMEPNKAQRHLDNVKRKLRKRRIINPRTGKMDLDFNPLSIEEDIFVATNKESKADVKILQGDLTLGNLADLEYFKQKLFTAYKVPKTYLSHEKDVGNRNIVSYQDMQFARTVRRIQFVITNELKKLFDLQLVLKGIDPKTVTYKIGLPVISVVDELRVWQTWQLKLLVATMFKQTFWPSDEWMLRNLLGYDDEETKKLLKDQNKPDEYSGLYQAPKQGNGPANIKTKTEMYKALDRLQKTNPEEFDKYQSAVSDLRMVMDWQNESIESEDA